MNEVINPKDASEPKLTLKTDFVDLLSCKVQMVFAGIAVLLICLYSWSGSLEVGFLLDDYLHLDYVSRAIHGDWQDFLANFTSNWAGSDLMKSYRPLVSVSLLADYLLWGVNAWGYHLTNLLLLAGCSLMVGLVSLELTGLRGNRLGAGAAIWSALLFAVYPLHLEAAAWIIGRVDLLCTLFYLISIFCYLRFRLIRERSYFQLSLIAFVAAMLSKEMAVTLPLVITAAELILQPFWTERAAPAFQANAKSRRITGVLSFWFVLGLLGTWRLFVLHELIGGYGASGLSSLKAFRNFLNTETLSRIFFPLNLDLLNRTGEQSAWDLRALLEKILKAAYLTIAAGGLLRVFSKSASSRILIFLAVWAIVALLPTYQIWLVSPNLVGSRLFFLSSAPFVILLSFLALPAIDAMSARMAKILACAGSLILMVILSIWSFWLQFDLQAWNGAAESLSSFRKQILANLSQLDSDKSILVLNLPTDYSGAGMLTRGRYLKFMMRPPLSSQDYSARVKTLDPTDENSVAEKNRTEPIKPKPAHEHYNYAKALEALLEDRNITRVLLWNEPTAASDTGLLTVWQGGKQNGDAHWTFKFGADDCKYIAAESEKTALNYEQLSLDRLQALPLNNGKEWTIVKDGGRSFQTTDSGLLIKPGTRDILLVLPAVQISPLKATLAEIQAKTISGSAPQLSFLWSSQGRDSKTAAKQLRASSPRKASFSSLAFQLTDKQVLSLGQNRAWIQTPLVRSLALLIPKGDYEIELLRLELK